MEFTKEEIRAVARERHTKETHVEVKFGAGFIGLMLGVILMELAGLFVGVPVLVGVTIYILVIMKRFSKGLKKVSDDLVSEWKLETLDPEALQQIGPVDEG
jgi:hypothetical protein